MGEAVLLAERRHGLRPDLEPVAAGDVTELRGIEVWRGHGGAELVEELLEAPRRDDLEDATRLVARVPEGVPLLPRLEHEVAHLGVDDIIAEQRAHASLDDVAVL